MIIVATTSLPAVDRPNADRWNAARSRQFVFRLPFLQDWPRNLLCFTSDPSATVTLLLLSHGTPLRLHVIELCVEGQKFDGLLWW